MRASGSCPAAVPFCEGRSAGLRRQTRWEGSSRCDRIIRSEFSVHGRRQNMSTLKEDAMTKETSPVVWLENLGRSDVARVGGKNASLGEMVRNLEKKGVRVPPGFATTAQDYWR